MTPLTIEQWECDGRVADAAVLPVEYLDHRVFCRALFYTHKDLGMAELTAVPDSVFLM